MNINISYNYKLISFRQNTVKTLVGSAIIFKNNKRDVRNRKSQFDIYLSVIIS